MAVQMPASAAAESRTFAGPWLRFGYGTGPLDGRDWRGSVLCCTKAAGAPAAPAADGRAPTTDGGWTAAAPAPAPAATASSAPAPGAAGSWGAAAGGGQPEAPVLVLQDASGGRGGGAAPERRLSPALLDRAGGWSIWRFELELQLTDWQRPIQYAVHAGGQSTPTYTFWLPQLGAPLHFGYYSCNGMSADVSPQAPERADLTYLWRDLLQLHSAFPLHALVGGGDQLYSDGVWECPSLKAWGASTEHDQKVQAPWTHEMEAQATRFYLHNYLDAFSAPDVDLAFAQIPQVMLWDDHDIWDGYGSYETSTQTCPVFQGLFKVARRFYLLFQQHTTDAFNSRAKEFLGANDGAEFHFLKYMGPQVALLGLDMRSQRTKERIMPQATYDLVRRTVEAMPAGPLHLVVLSGIPLIFPKIPAAESILGCFGGMVRRLPAIKRAARDSGILDRFDQPEILDDLVDGWVANVHTEERLQFIRMLQDFSTGKGLRVSILSGDAHVGGVGRLYSRPKIKDLGEDPLFMPQIISSAIVNAPPPHPVTKMLMRTNFASNVDGRTREKLVRAFYPYHPRTDKLIAQRNWCDISLVAPPFSPPTVPQDPQFGGLRFILRVENTNHRRGYADETYIVVVPRHPSARSVQAPAGAGGLGSRALPVPAGVPLPAPEAALELQQQERSQGAQKQQHVHKLPANVVAPEEGEGGLAAAGPAGGPPQAIATPPAKPASAAAAAAAGEPRPAYEPATPVPLV